MRRLALPVFSCLILCLFAGAGCQTPSSPVGGTKADRSRHSTPGSPGSGASELAIPRLSDSEIDQRSRAHAAFGAGIIRQMQEDTDGMLDYWNRAVDADPENLALAMEVARRRLFRREPEEAIVVLERVIRAPAGSLNGAVWSVLGLAYVQSGRTNEAIAAYRRGLGDESTRLGAYASLGRLLVDTGQAKEAMIVMADAEKQEPGNVVYQLDVAELYGQLAERHPEVRDDARSRAIAALERVEGVGSSDPGVLLRLAERNSALGRGEAAERALQKIREQGGGGGGMAAARLAEMYMRAGRLDDAVEQLEALRRDAPSNPMPPYFLGVISFERRDFERAAECFERALLLDPVHEPSNIDLISALLSLGKPEAALEWVKRGRARLKPMFRLEYLAGLAHGRLKQHAEAVAALRQAETLAAGNAAILDHRFRFQLGVELEMAGETAESESLMLEVLRSEPDFAPALNHLGYTWADKGRNLEESLGMIRRAVTAEPDNAAYLDSLGWVLFRLGRFEEAVPPLEKAVELLGEELDPTVLDHLGDVMAALKRWPEAKRAWEGALKLEASEVIRGKLEAAP